MHLRDIGEIAAEAKRFGQRLDAIKARTQSPAFEWYPYNSLSTFGHLDRLLTGPRRDLAALIGDEKVLDAGCADGEIAFFFESLGCRVRAIDCPATNNNFMLGLGALRSALGSSVETAVVDMDAQFRLPDERYGLALFLGVLYHLKNPYYVLEELARHARHLLLSTRITRTLAHGAYLVNERELNNDITNFWLFSEAGLPRLLNRSNWEVCDWLMIPDHRDPAPAGLDRDDRVFCLARSTWTWHGVELGGGWYADEGRGWRWTRPRFEAARRFPPEPASCILRVQHYVPRALLARRGSVVLRAAVNGTDLEPETYTRAGDHLYVRTLDATVLSRGCARVEFQVQPELPPDEFDPRERGIIVVWMRFDSA